MYFVSRKMSMCLRGHTKTVTRRRTAHWVSGCSIPTPTRLLETQAITLTPTHMLKPFLQPKKYLTTTGSINDVLRDSESPGLKYSVVLGAQVAQRVLSENLNPVAAGLRSLVNVNVWWRGWPFPTSELRGHVALVVYLPGFYLGSGRQIDFSWFGLLEITWINVNVKRGSQRYSELSKHGSVSICLQP